MWKSKSKAPGNLGLWSLELPPISPKLLLLEDFLYFCLQLSLKFLFSIPPPPRGLNPGPRSERMEFSPPGNSLSVYLNTWVAVFFCSLSFVVKLGLTLATPWTGDCQALLSMGFSRQEYWSGVPFLLSLPPFTPVEFCSLCSDIY